MSANPIQTFHSHTAMPWVALTVSGSLLVGAWVFQYGFGYDPCTMCYWQRHAHKAVIIVSILALLAQRFAVRSATLLRWLLVLAFLVSFGIAAWHVGVEFGWLEGPKVCAGGVGAAAPAIDPNDPLAFLDGAVEVPSCSEPLWHFLGLSMAAWNALISLMAAVWIATSRPSARQTDRV